MVLFIRKVKRKPRSTRILFGSFILHYPNKYSKDIFGKVPLNAFISIRMFRILSKRIFYKTDIYICVSIKLISNDNVPVCCGLWVTTRTKKTKQKRIK